MQGCYVGDQGLIAIGQNCKQLKAMSLRFCEGLTDSGLVGLAEGCGSSLISIGIAACDGIREASLQAVASHCRYLEALSLDSEVVKTEGIISIAQGCRSLKALKLRCLDVSDKALEAVGSFCSSLELLALHSFDGFTDRHYVASLQLNFISIEITSFYFWLRDAIEDFLTLYTSTVVLV